MGGKDCFEIWLFDDLGGGKVIKVDDSECVYVIIIFLRIILWFLGR